MCIKTILYNINIYSSVDSKSTIDPIWFLFNHSWRKCKDDKWICLRQTHWWLWWRWTGEGVTSDGRQVKGCLVTGDRWWWTGAEWHKTLMRDVSKCHFPELQSEATKTRSNATSVSQHSMYLHPTLQSHTQASLFKMSWIISVTKQS